MKLFYFVSVILTYFLNKNEMDNDFHKFYFDFAP